MTYMRILKSTIEITLHSCYNAVNTNTEVGTYE